VGCYGNAQVKTPNINRLAGRGVRFKHAYAQYPVCNPSRTSFLTGMRCEQTGVVDNRTMFRTQLPDVVTMPQMLRQAGWHTASYGKVFHVGEAMGEVREGWMDVGKSWDDGQMFKPTAAGKVIEGRNLTDGKLKWCEWGMTAGEDQDQPDGQSAWHGIAAIERYTAAGQPWMVAVGFHRPHDPFISPKKYFELYPSGSLTIYHDPPGATPMQALSLPGGAFAEAFKAFTDNDRAEFLRAYYAGVSFMDAQVGKLLDTLDRLELWDQTLVVFVSDHGYHHNERGWWNKNTLFERSCRVPCIVAAPGAKQGEVCRGIVELVDLYPTIADYCGVTAPHALAGQSLRSLVENPGREGKEAAFTLVTRGLNRYGQTVRTDRWRYIQWSDESAELYDHLADPEEMHDLSAAPAQAAVVGELKQMLAETVPYSPGRDIPARKQRAR
jgi:iduronate 2-sulfatase